MPVHHQWCAKLWLPALLHQQASLWSFCWSECCRDLTRPHQPNDPAVLKKIKEVQRTGSSQRARSVQYQWFKIFTCSRGKLYSMQCHCCANQGGRISKKLEAAFTVHSFKNWKHAFLVSRSIQAANTTESVAQFQVFVSQQPSISTQVDTQVQVTQRDSREMLMKQLAVVLPYSRQWQSQCSNLYKLMLLRSQDSADTNSGWMSHDIVNEIINLISLYVLGKVLWLVWDGCYAVLRDKTRHNSNKEQFVTVLHRVDDTFAVWQDFVVLFVLPKTDAHTIFTVLNDVLTQCLPILPGCTEGRHTTVLHTCQATWRESLQTLKRTILHQYLPDQALPPKKTWIQVSTK